MVSDFDASEFTKAPAGLPIRAVVANSAAARAGLVPGDVIVSVNGQGITNLDASAAMAALRVPGDELTLAVIHPFAPLKFDDEFDFLIGSHHSSASEPTAAAPRGRDVEVVTLVRGPSGVGLTLARFLLSSDFDGGALYPVDFGLPILSVRAGSPGAEAGLCGNDVIVEIDRREVGRMNYVDAIAAMKGESVRVGYVRGRIRVEPRSDDLPRPAPLSQRSPMQAQQLLPMPPLVPIAAADASFGPRPLIFVGNDPPPLPPPTLSPPRRLNLRESLRDLVRPPGEMLHPPSINSV